MLTSTSTFALAHELPPRPRHRDGIVQHTQSTTAMTTPTSNWARIVHPWLPTVVPTSTEAAVVEATAATPAVMAPPATAPVMPEAEGSNQRCNDGPAVAVACRHANAPP